MHIELDTKKHSINNRAHSTMFEESTFNPNEKVVLAQKKNTYIARKALKQKQKRLI